MLGQALDVNCSRGQCLDWTILDYVPSPSISFLMDCDWLCTKDLVRSDTTCPLNVQVVKSIILPEAHCTTAPGPQEMHRSQRPLVVTKLPLPPVGGQSPHENLQSPMVGNLWFMPFIALLLCKSDILTLGHYEIEV